MATLTADNLPDPKDTMRTDRVDLSDLGLDGTVNVRSLSQAEMREAYKLGREQDIEANAYIASKAAVDDEGKPVFKITWLRSADWQIANRIAQVSQRLSNAVPEDDDEGKD